MVNNKQQQQTLTIPPTTTQNQTTNNNQNIQNLLPSHFGSKGKVTLLSTPRGGPLPEHTPTRKLRLFALQLLSHIISNSILVIIVVYALIKRCLTKAINQLLQLPTQSNHHKKISRQWDLPHKFKHEKVTKDFHYYAKQAGYEIIEQTVETLDGYFLKVWKIVKPGQERFTLKNGKGGYPVLIQHGGYIYINHPMRFSSYWLSPVDIQLGLFQSSGSFITSEERSLAFWLAEHGYVLLLYIFKLS